ncbi:MAG: response regulator transcription factor [Chloroflexi bacterium]|nr:response regulator transcription factor [Chloroflexota bacterium]
MDERSISIVLVEDHKIVRQGVRALLEMDPHFKVIGEAGTASDALHLAQSLRPDVVVTDLVMNGANGIELTKQVRERCPATRVILLSMYDNSGYVYEALRCGASGYVLKGAGIDDLAQAIMTVVSGRIYLSPPLSQEDVERYGRQASTTSDV